MDIDLDDARKCVETNVFGVLAVTRAVATHMAKRGSGKIANIGSVVGYASTPWAGKQKESKKSCRTCHDHPTTIRCLCLLQGCSALHDGCPSPRACTAWHPSDSRRSWRSNFELWQQCSDNN